MAPSTRSSSATHPATRIASIDVLRGLTILTMIFVNDVAGVKNIPAWMKHVPSGENGMTFVDVVFPAFLFIVGMSIPFAMATREKKGDSPLQRWQHILLRTLALLVIGVFMVNSEGGNYNESAMLLDIHPWTILIYVFAILIWNQYPKTPEKQRLYKGLQIAGILGLASLFLLYRGGDGTQMMRPHWWGILGLIGWAYLYACAVYLFSSRSLTAVVGMIGVFIAMYMGMRAEGMELPILLDWLKGQGGNASHAAVVLAGTALSLLIINQNPQTEYPRLLRQILGLAALLALAGFFLEPFYGIQKNAATPTWGLYSAAICTTLFAFLYWLMDVKGIVSWSQFLRPAGANALLIYFLPPIFYAGLAWSGLTFYSALGFGMVGIIRSVVFALLMILAVTWLNKRGVSLKI